MRVRVRQIVRLGSDGAASVSERDRAMRAHATPCAWQSPPSDGLPGSSAQPATPWTAAQGRSRRSRRAGSARARQASTGGRIAGREQMRQCVGSPPPPPPRPPGRACPCSRSSARPWRRGQATSTGAGARGPVRRGRHGHWRTRARHQPHRRPRGRHGGSA
jgi:hypothetical protein